MRVVVRAADFAVVIDVGRGPLAPLHGEARAEEQAVPARLGAVGGEGAAAAIGKVGLDGVAVLSVLSQYVRIRILSAVRQYRTMHHILPL